MAIKPFEIQSSTITIGGVDLEAGNTSVVIPGVTQAVNYKVEEVQDTGDQTDTIEGTVAILDAVQFAALSANPNADISGYATYTVELDDDYYIDEIEVTSPGTYTQQQATTNESSDMWVPGASGDVFDPFVAADWFQVPFRPKMRAGEIENIGSGEGLPTVTVPAEIGTAYKGLQVAYGGFHSNGQTSTRNVTKVVIHKPAVTTVSITEDSNDDFFQVSGVGSSDVLAMFVLWGDINGEKPLSDIVAFAESVIDNVILEDGVQGQYRTVDEMKTAFYGNFQALLASAGGLATDFEFFNINTYFGVNASTLVQGSGAMFDITGSGTDYEITVGTAGIDYKVGHKIRIAGTDIGQSDTRWDLVLTVSGVDANGGVTAVTYELYIPNFYATGTWTGVAGTNTQLGSGVVIYELNYNLDNDTISLANWNNASSTPYVVGDEIRILGTDIIYNGQPLVSPDNDLIVTFTQVDSQYIVSHTVTGTLPRPEPEWRENSISDGGFDEYDTGNYIDSSYDEQIGYNGGETVVNSASAFGTGSSYSVVYQDSVFGLFVTGNSSTRIGTSGSGPDSGSIIISGHIYGPSTAEQTFDNAVSHINIIGNPYAGPLVRFTKVNYGDQVDEISEGLHITSGDQGWLYNPLVDNSYGSNTPTGSLWNNDGWDDFSNIESRTYTPLESIWGGNFVNIPGAKMVMLDETTGKYWAIEFLSWTAGQNGAGFSYTRQELDLGNLETGIRFSDGTRQTTAYVADNVKLRSPGNRRIEEAHGYKQVSVTSRVTTNTITTTAFSSNSSDTRQVNLSASGAERDALIALANGNVAYRVQVSLNQADWATGSVNGWGSTDVAIYFDNGVTLPVAENDTVYYRTYTGGDPVVWWDSDDLPNGRSGFRGAVIDYHAYTSDATWVGTIHIVDDDGEENITHTEVSSGSTDGENDDLWYVTNEGEIKYRRIDGESATLKIQWTAKVFYGSETYD